MTPDVAVHWKRRLRIVALCAAILPVAHPGLAADAEAPAAQYDRPIETLLRVVEQKIATDHTASPAGDAAIDVWKQVIRAVPTTDSARVTRALTIFAKHM
jgi:hypothetical protein